MSTKSLARQLLESFGEGNVNEGENTYRVFDFDWSGNYRWSEKPTILAEWTKDRRVIVGRPAAKDSKPIKIGDIVKMTNKDYEFGSFIKESK